MFSDVLNRYVERSGYNPGQLARLTGIPKSTLVNWLVGRVEKPRGADEVVKLAATLHLNAPEASELLRAAGYPPIVQLIAQADAAQREKLLGLWVKELCRDLDHSPFQAIADLPYFVGRDKDIQRLTTALVAAEHKTVYAVQGMGGAGKTVLAARVAYQLRSYFQDGVLWARLGASDTLSILGTFASAYDHDLSGYRDISSRSRAVREILADKHALIVLDGAWNSEQVIPLLPPTGPSAVLITTRRRDILATHGVQRFDIGPFESEKREALELFAKVLGEDSAEQEQATLIEIADVLGHLPLAIAIAASHLTRPGLSAADFLRRVQHPGQRLDNLVCEDHSVRSAFDQSFAMLSADYRRFYAAVATFDGDFTVNDAARITGLPQDKVQDMLKQLYVWSLTHQDGRADYYRLHPLLRDYAQSLAKK